MSEEFGLKRVLGLGDLVAIEVGTTVGAGIFALTAVAAKFTGPSVPLCFLAAAVPIAMVMLTVGALGAALPTVGGTYRYPSRLFSPRWATVGVWCYALALVFGGLPMYASQCVSYLWELFPAGRAPTGDARLFYEALASVGLLTFFWLVNLGGVEIAAGAQALMVVVMLLALLMFGGWGLPALEWRRFDPLFTGGASGFVLAACILTFALQGSNSVIELGAEIKQARRNIPLSLLISIPLVVVLYVVVSGVGLGNIDLAGWAGEKGSTLAQPARSFLSPGLFYFFILGGAVLAFTTTLNGTFMWATKSLMVVANDGIMPAALAKTNQRGAPSLFLTMLWAGATAAVIMEALAWKFFPLMKKTPLEIFASYATLGGMVVFIPVMIAAILMPRRAPALAAVSGYRLKGAMLYLAPGVGIGLSALMILILLVDLGWWSLPFLAWMGLGFGFFSLRKKAIEARTGEPLARAMERDLEAMIRARE